VQQIKNELNLYGNQIWYTTWSHPSPSLAFILDPQGQSHMAWKYSI